MRKRSLAKILAYKFYVKVTRESLDLWYVHCIYPAVTETGHVYSLYDRREDLLEDAHIAYDEREKFCHVVAYAFDVTCFKAGVAPEDSARIWRQLNVKQITKLAHKIFDEHDPAKVLAFVVEMSNPPIEPDYRPKEQLPEDYYAR